MLNVPVEVATPVKIVSNTSVPVLKTTCDGILAVSEGTEPVVGVEVTTLVPSIQTKTALPLATENIFPVLVPQFWTIRPEICLQVNFP